MTWTDEQIAAAEHFANDIEDCGWCGAFEPWDELEALIGTPRICFACRKKEKLRRLAELFERANDGLGLA